MMLKTENIMATTPAPPKPAAHHAAYRSWSTSWYDAHGKRHWKRFGKVGEMPKAVAMAIYRKWLANDWEKKNSVRDGSGRFAYTVKDLCIAYAEVCRKRYVKNGKLTSHIDNVECALNALLDAHGKEPADSIGSPQLTKLRDAMANSRHRFRNLPRLLSVSTVNGRLKILKQAYKWARSQGYVTREAAVDVAMTAPMRANDGGAKPPEIIRPVPDDILEMTIRHAPKTVADMMRLQVVTGMRSGEMCAMRPCDINASDETCWSYLPLTHKTEGHGKTRIVYIGPVGQQILKQYTNKRKMTEFVFLPADAHRERLEMNGYQKVMAYQMSRSVFKPGRSYDRDTYRNAVNRAADRAFDADGKKRADGNYSHRWHPHQLRHNFATMIRATRGVEAASVLLGHSNLNTTEIYAERNQKIGIDAIRKVG